MRGQFCRNESLLVSFLPLKISALKMSHDRCVNGREKEGPSTSVYITPPNSLHFYQNLTLYLIVPCNISFHYTAYLYKMKGMKQLCSFNTIIIYVTAHINKFCRELKIKKLQLEIDGLKAALAEERISNRSQFQQVVYSFFMKYLQILAQFVIISLVMI